MSAEETEDCLVHPDTRTIKQVTVDDIQATDVLFETLMGGAAVTRKKFIQEHSLWTYAHSGCRNNRICRNCG